MAWWTRGRATVIGRSYGAWRKPARLGDVVLDVAGGATAVVMDGAPRARVGSARAHLVGRFVRFDLWRLFDPRYDPSGDDAVPTLPEDPIRASGAYEAWLAAGSPHTGEPGANHVLEGPRAAPAAEGN